MTKDEVYQLLKGISDFPSIEKHDGGYRLILQDGLGWVDIDENETCVWDDMECFFSESFVHTNLNPEEVEGAFHTAVSNLSEVPKDWWEENEEE